MSTIAVVDYGMGNLHSVGKALERVAEGARVIITDDPKQVDAADRVVFPGVGAIADCMTGLREKGLDQAILRAAGSRPLLAVCVGMQAVMTWSEENGGTECLGLFDGHVRHFPAGAVDEAGGGRLKIPHMGWNQVRQVMDHPLWAGIGQDTRFYFVHSYRVEAEGQPWAAGMTDYGGPFVAAAARDNLFTMQCHPEKSHHAGLALLANFARWDGTAS